MKHIVYGGDAGKENDISWGKCPKTRRQVTGKVSVVISILGHQRKATRKCFLNRFFKYAYLSRDKKETAFQTTEGGRR